jgi:hypothetical protein
MNNFMNFVHEVVIKAEIGNLVFFSWGFMVKLHKLARFERAFSQLAVLVCVCEHGNQLVYLHMPD